MKNIKELGQNWLKNRAILDEIAEIASDSPSADDLNSKESRMCLEIGPGLGTLTSSLLKVFPQVIAVEFDARLAENLPKSFPGKNLKVVNQDFLKFNLEDLKRPYVVAGNIPYYITSPIIQKLVKSSNKPDRIVLLIQKEVAERIAASEGKHTVLSLTVQNYARISLGPVVPKTEFTPIPKVDSQVIILEPFAKPLVPESTLALIKRGFSAPRKKLIKNLGQLSKDDLKMTFLKLDISVDARPADLSLETWQKLASFFSCQS